MKECFFKKSFFLILFGALLTTGVVRADKTWPTGGNATNATDEDVYITGDAAINDDITVSAATSDVNVYVQADATLTGASGNPRLFLTTGAVQRKITFHIDNDLFFSGDSDSTLMVAIQGAGDVEFIIDGTKKVSFSASSVGVFGTHLFMIMHETTPPTLLFKRKSSSSDHVEVIVGAGSLMSYVARKTVTSGTADETGTIFFDPANTGTGRMALRIEDTGAVYIGGNYTASSAVPGMLLSDVDMAIPAGLQASFYVTNGDGSSYNSSLLVINSNQTLTSYLINPWLLSTAFDGVRYGFILGANAQMVVADNSFVDYVGLALDACQTPAIPADVLDGRTVEQVVKARNASAFIVDGNADVEAANAKILLGDASAIVFRSGIDSEGTSEGSTYSFLITPSLQSPDEGNIVFDVEGLLDIDGSGGSGNNKLEVLSWEVDPTGGSVLIRGSEDKFPLRTFAQSGGEYLQYNAGCFFVNNRMNLRDTILVHTDKAHSVYEKDDIQSEPTYIGGDTFVIDGTSDRPKMALYNSAFFIHTCVALTGVDLFIPNLETTGNSSVFLFYQNGIAYRDGTGRQMILGTQSGSATCDPCCAAISKDAHLDIFQDVVQVGSSTHLLSFSMSYNDTTIMPGITGDISNQTEIHTIYLGHSSNISVGTAGGTFTDPVQGAGQTPDTTPTLRIGGNYLSFETRGGPESSPELSALSGRGGIFIDTNGLFEIGDPYRANMSTMVVKTDNGVINLPLSRVFFDDRVGIADWQLDLTDAAQRIIVADSDTLSDYTLNWRSVIKDYDNFTPYEVSDYDPCNCPTVTALNIASLPEVAGTVEQFQIKGSRLGNAAHVKVADGWIRELLFLGGCDSAEAPTAVVVLEDGGRVGIGSAHRNRDSLGSSIVLGVNGVTIIANGDGVVDINEDVIINNICHVLRGPDFDPEVDTFNSLVFHSDCCRSIRVKSGGVLDLSSFTQPNHIVEIGGNLKLILEQGSKIVLGGGTLRITDDAFIETAEVDLTNFTFGSSTSGLDPIRVKFIGTGFVELFENATFFVGDNSYVGIEVDTCYAPTTSLTFEVGDSAKVLIGADSGINNSAFQVGNTTEVVDSSVEFTLNLSGVDSLFSIASRGFVGFGVGVVDNFFQKPSDWRINTLHNLSAVTINVPAGTFKHDRIFSSEDFYASLLAILNDEVADFTFTFEGPITGNSSQTTILGGGNMALVAPGEDDTDWITATVDTADGFISARLSVGLFSSKAILDSKLVIVSPVTGAGLFGFWKTLDFVGFNGGFSNASQDEHNLLSLGYVDREIVRGLIDEIAARTGIPIVRKDFVYTLSIGAVLVDLGVPALVPRGANAVFELP